jgi:hypothetical protein
VSAVNLLPTQATRPFGHRSGQALLLQVLTLRYADRRRFAHLAAANWSMLFLCALPSSGIS